MGRQIAFYMLGDDCKEFLAFVQNRDPVIVVPYTSFSPGVREIHSPCDKGNRVCLWNQSLLTSFQYRYIPESDDGPYYRTDDSLPVLEFSWGPQEKWNGRQVLRPGRVWCSFEYDGEKAKDLERWFNSIARWLRKNYHRNPSSYLGGYVGPAAYEWFKKGGLLLGTYLPPLPPSEGWLKVLEKQDKARQEILKSDSPTRRPRHKNAST